MLILGCFFGGLAWISYKGLVHVNWNAMANQTQAGITNAAKQVTHSDNHSSSTASTLRGSGG